MTLFPTLVAVHVALALALLVPSVLLPFALRPGAAALAGESRGTLVRALLAVQARASGIVGAGLALTGIALVALLGPQLLRQPWLLAALAMYALNLVVAFFVQRPELIRLSAVRAARDDVTWRARARRQRYVSYAVAGLTGTIGFLMSTKPVLW
ncbi:MAG TPA: hypothetical protein VFI28_05960 [Candidatus Limnocylindrales bacterium]|nr:hypothetical protein [Candidatus Limnocylindrales bacterium]